ncbi:MAG: hypothetical protein ACYCUW_01845 [bacterium]
MSDEYKYEAFTKLCAYMSLLAVIAILAFAILQTFSKTVNIHSQIYLLGLSANLSIISLSTCLFGLMVVHGDFKKWTKGFALPLSITLFIFVLGVILPMFHVNILQIKHS